MGRTAASWIVVCILFAGCSGGDDKQASASVSTSAPPPTVTADTGSIEGTVTDEEQVPIAGVTVALLERTESQVSDASGRFVFNNLSAGGYKLVSEKLGYESVARAVTVALSEVTKVQLVVKAIEVKKDRIIEMVPHEGYIQCSVNPLYPVNPCGGILGADKNRFPFTIDKNRTLVNAVFELVWKPGSAATGSAMELDVCDDLESKEVICLNADFDEYDEGASPVVVRIEEFPLKTQTTFLVAAGAPQDPPAPIVQQAFTIYVSLCYYGECDEEYSAIPPP